MNKINDLCLFLISFVLLASCSKQQQGPFSKATGKLVKTVSISDANPTDSVVTQYGYDKKNMVISIKYVFYRNAEVPARSINSGVRFYRDGHARIVEIASLGISDGPVAPDTSYTEVLYKNHTGNEVDYTLRLTHNSGKSSYDSTRYIYNSNGQLWYTEKYLNNDFPVAETKLYAKEIWEYDGVGNPVQYELYQQLRDPDLLSLIFRYGFIYDDKMNPLSSEDDVRMNEWIMPHNIIRQSVFEAISGSSSENQFAYEYTAGGLPLRRIQFGPYPSIMTFYYDK